MLTKLDTPYNNTHSNFNSNGLIRNSTQTLTVVLFHNIISLGYND